jgi:phosphomethylpyrimidine synthase
MAFLNNSQGGFVVGPGSPTRVNALIGASSKAGILEQNRKIDAILGASVKPDIVSDLSIIDHCDSKLWLRIVNETDFVSGTLPVYTAKICEGRVDDQELLEIAIEQMEGGVRLITIHPTVNNEMLAAAESRLVPMTSRGGTIIARDLKARSAHANAYLRILPELIVVARATGAVISLGATFRSANIFDSYDLAQRLEISSQLKLAAEIKAAGVDVIVEGPGHARPADIHRVAALLSPSGFPIMPLGPIPTDTAIGFDHVSAAIGATLFGLAGCGHVLAAVTREEHTGGVPSIASTLEAIASARVVGQIIDLELLGADVEERYIATARSEAHSCILGNNSKGCSRCASLCPL